MHVLVIGGTGFIGYHIVSTLLEQGHSVSLLCRSPIQANRMFADRVTYHQGDLDFFHNLDFQRLFHKVDAMIYAAGADERAETQGDPYTFFYRENVTACISLLEKARQHGINQAIVLGSIFTYLDGIHPDLNLAQEHPYIHARADQKREALLQSAPDFHVNLVEIPFVFGASPFAPPLWRNIINYIRVATPLMVTPGGMNVMSVYSLSQAICNALTYVEETCPLVVGDQNMSWTDLMLTLNQHVNHKEKPITLLNRQWLSDLTKIGAYLQGVLGWQSGLNQREISKIIMLEAFFDTTSIKQRLHYAGNDLDQAFADTVEACPEPAVLNRMHRTMNWLSDNSRDFVYGLDQSLQRLKR